MSNAGKAVFLSYASQDAGAVERIAEALRESGVEVWFDKDELVGGDAWDAKIRGQVASCALFVPLISANTQARLEGYFRLEWKLAANRSHTMAEEKAFLLPVVIDATRDAEAKVPAEFRAVQWTRLPGGETSAAFVARVQSLIDGPSAVRPAANPTVRFEAPVAPAAKVRPMKWVAAAAGALLLAAVAYWALRPAAKDVAAPVPSSDASKPAVPAVSEKSVAVLAFADMSADKGSEYFSDGVSEELLNVLAKVPGLKVSARTSAFYFKGKNLPIPEIAAKLNVAYVVEGSVQRAGERVKITAQLIKAADGFHLWSDTFTRDAKDVFAVQEEIAGLIAKQLSLKLGASSAAATAAIDPQAFEFYVRAREAWKLRTLADYDRAEDLLNRALALEPNFARAHAALADVWFLRALDKGLIGSFAQRGSAEFARIKDRINQALALDPDLAEAHTSLGGLAWMGWDSPTSERELRRAIALNPNYATAHQWLGRTLNAQGRLEEGLVELKLATELDPLAPRILDNYTIGLSHAGRYAEAIEYIDRALALQPNAVQARTFKVGYLLSAGRVAEAVDLARTLPIDQDAGCRAAQGVALALAGLRAEAAALLVGFSPKDEGAKAAILFALGRMEEAITLVKPESIFANNLENFLFAPNLDPIRRDPRVVRLFADLGATEAHARAQAWRAAHPLPKAK